MQREHFDLACDEELFDCKALLFNDRLSHSISGQFIFIKLAGLCLVAITEWGARWMTTLFLLVCVLASYWQARANLISDQGYLQMLQKCFMFRCNSQTTRYLTCYNWSPVELKRIPHTPHEGTFVKSKTAHIATFSISIMLARIKWLLVC